MSPIVISRFIEYVKQRYEETNRPKVSVHLSDSVSRSYSVLPPPPALTDQHPTADGWTQRLG
jgi:hypothetical protein